MIPGSLGTCEWCNERYAELKVAMLRDLVKTLAEPNALETIVPIAEARLCYHCLKLVQWTQGRLARTNDGDLVIYATRGVGRRTIS